MKRWYVRYRFTDSGDEVGVYRSAESLEAAFKDEADMWVFWGKQIEFVMGRCVSPIVYDRAGTKR